MQEPIRLVCPDCDTVHRVKSVTLGKLYRCKKCKAGLVTMSPAIVKCPGCGHSLPPAHVDVSRLITCNECESAPLMTLEFPPPIMPVKELRQEAKASVEEYDDDASENEPIETHAEAFETPARNVEEEDEPPRQIADEEEEDGRDFSRNEDEHPNRQTALARPEQEDRAISALKKVMDDVQAPLIDEIERTRSSIPVYVVGIIALPVIALLGYLTFSHLKAGSQETELAAAHERIKHLEEEINRLTRESKQAQIAATKFMEQATEAQKELNSIKPNYQNARASVESLKKSRDALTTLVKKWQKIAADNMKKKEEYERRLRALGHDPER